MDLRPGARVGVFEIIGPLGAGGMGEVYRARDTRLSREVAIKILPPSVSHDAERVARFDREARLLASLNHPGIGGIYGVEEWPGGRLLILELVPGETLADRIARGPLPLMEALSICRQIADAVAFAHASGIVHRDLKPANVKCTPNGIVKVLDFGLAKALAFEPAGVDGGESATVPAETHAGTILGTPDYMSPEQVRAQDIGRPDRRTDIWSLGCILYETLTGQRPFRGATLPDTLAAVLGRDPDWSVLPAETPTAIRALLRRCLQRDRERRMHDMADVRIELDEAIAAPIAATTGSDSDVASGFNRTYTSMTKTIRALEWALAAILLCAIVAGFLLARRSGWTALLANELASIAMNFSIPMVLYFKSAYLTPFVFGVIVLLWGAFAVAGRPWRTRTLRALLVGSAVIVTAGTLAGQYLVNKQAVLHVMRLSLGVRGIVVERDLSALHLAAGDPAQVIALLDPKHTRDYPVDNFDFFLKSPGLAFQLAEAYRAQGDVEAARRIYRRAQESATAFDEVFSQGVLSQVERWQSEYGFADADWGPSVSQLRRLPDVLRAVAQQRIDQLPPEKRP